MSPAYFDTGFSVREPMWHGLGIVLEDYPTTWTEAREKAGLQWEPEERAAWMMRPLAAFADGEIPTDAIVTPDGVFVKVPDHKLIVRSDTELVLGVTSDGFSAIYHGDDEAQRNDGASMEEIIDAFKGADGSLKFETAGSVRDGRHVWALMYLDEPYTLPGDDTEHLPFVAVLNSHDGTGACKLINTQVRVVCWNTWQAAVADGERTGRNFTFRHTGDVRDRIDEAKQAIAGLRVETDDYKAMAKELTDLRVDDGAVAAFLTEFLPSPRENGEVCSDRVHENVEKARATWRWLYGESPTTETIRGTGFGVLQASTEYLDHARAFRSPDSYLGRSILRAEPAKAKALQLIRGMS